VKVDDLIRDTDDNNSPYTLITKLCAMRKSAKSSIPRGKMHKFNPFWTKELTNQRNKRDQAQEIAEKSKDEEEKRRNVINWRRECAIMKTKSVSPRRKHGISL